MKKPNINIEELLDINYVGEFIQKYNDLYREYDYLFIKEEDSRLVKVYGLSISGSERPEFSVNKKTGKVIDNSITSFESINRTNSITNKQQNIKSMWAKISENPKQPRFISWKNFI